MSDDQTNDVRHDDAEVRKDEPEHDGADRPDNGQSQNAKGDNAPADNAPKKPSSFKKPLFWIVLVLVGGAIVDRVGALLSRRAAL